MKKTLLLALALGVFAGCADDSADVVDTDTTVVEPAVPVTEPTDDLMDDPLVDDSTMMDDTMMEDGVMEDGVMEGDAGMDESDEMLGDEGL